MNKENINVIDEENLSDEDRQLLISKKKIHAHRGDLCPKCGLDTIDEQTMGYERVSFCTNCEYSSSRTI